MSAVAVPAAATPVPHVLVVTPSFGGGGPLSRVMAVGREVLKFVGLAYGVALFMVAMLMPVVLVVRLVRWLTGGG